MTWHVVTTMQLCSFLLPMAFTRSFYCFALWTWPLQGQIQWLYSSSFIDENAFIELQDHWSTRLISLRRSWAEKQHQKVHFCIALDLWLSGIDKWKKSNPQQERSWKVFKAYVNQFSSIFLITFGECFDVKEWGRNSLSVYFYLLFIWLLLCHVSTMLAVGGLFFLAQQTYFKAPSTKC